MHPLVETGKSLGEEETLQVPCPKCNGGGSKERNFYITRKDNLLLYVCHRASCGYKGAIPLIGVAPSSKEPAVKPLRRFEGRLETLPRELYDKMYKKYEIPYEELVRQGFKYATDLNRIYIPHYDYQGRLEASTAKAVSRQSKPKAINYRLSNGHGIYFPLGRETATRLEVCCVLAEDVLSGVKLSQRWFCGYLNGTNLSDEGVKHLLSIGVKEVKLMLDGDNAGRIATKKLHNKLTPFFTVKAIYIPMGCDPKDMSYEELEEYLG